MRYLFPFTLHQPLQRIRDMIEREQTPYATSGYGPTDTERRASSDSPPPPPRRSSTINNDTPINQGSQLTPSQLTPTQAPRPRSSTPQTRGSGFSQTEVDRLLHHVDCLKPLCREEWDGVLAAHTNEFPEENRTVDSLKRKFASLHRRKIPTGDPLCPDDVRRAKRIRYAMTERADVGDGAEATQIAEEVLSVPPDVTDTGTSSPIPNLHPAHDDNEQASESPVDVMPTSSRAAASPAASSASPAASSSAAVLSDSVDVPHSHVPVPALQVPHDAPPSATVPRPSFFPRPVVSRRLSRQADSDNSLSEFLKILVTEDQKRRADEHRWREEDRQRREQQTREERDRRNEEGERHQKFMEMILLVLAGKQNHDATSS